MNIETLRNTFKLTNQNDIPASDHDALVRLLTRKTTMNYQNHRVYPVQADTTEWAHRLICWSCETKLGIYNIETLDHAVQNCPCLTDIRKDTLGLLGLYCSFPQQTTTAHKILWGQFYRLSSCDKKCDFLGNLFNSVITSEILKIRNKKWANSLNFGKNIIEKFRAIMRVKPRCQIACEVAARKLVCFNQNVRPPE